MSDGDTSDCYTGSHIAVREVYRVFNISVFKEISNFFNCHYCTVFFRFLSRCTKMWCYKDSRSSCNQRVCKVCYIFLNLSAVKCSDQCFFIYKKISRKVQKYNTVFHLCESLFVYHLASIISKWYMNGDVIALAVDLIQRFAVFDGSGKIPCRINGNKRIVSINFHTKMCCRVCNHGTDRTKANDTKLFTADLTSCKLLFLLFCQFVDVFFVFFMCYPLDTTNDITGSKKHTCKDKFFDTICICSRCIKYNNTFFCTHVNRNVVDTCTCTCDNFDILREFHVMHFCTSYQNRIGIVQVFCLFVFFTKQAETCLGNWIEAFILEHYAFSSSNFFMNATRASTPSFGIAL